MLNGIPTLSADLVESLDKTVPHRCPSPSDDERSIWMYAGKRELIDSLLIKLQLEETLSGVILK